MFYEKIQYLDDFPINIRILNIDEYPIHYHQDVEIAYVLKGDLKMKSGYCCYLLNEGEIFINNGHEVHYMQKTRNENTVAVIHISNQFFTQYFPDLYESCYRTYNPNKEDPRLDQLRKLLLTVLSDYVKKSFNYKNLCIDAMIETIKFLNENFNLFTFKDDMIVNFENNNPIVVERISRIINYLYQNFSKKITLEALAEEEHLSTFYLSHLISDCTGMSFREFLCFARVEMSEINLLGTDDKVNVIARDVGFSTTAYYEKYFTKWFGRSPEEHRRKFKPLAKSTENLEDVSTPPTNKVITILRGANSMLSSQDRSSKQINQLKLDINIDSKAEPISTIHHKLDISITLEDFIVMGFVLFDKLSIFRASRVTLLVDPKDDPNEIEALKAKLISKGFETVISNICTLSEVEAFGYDSIAAPIQVFNKYLLAKDEYVPVHLRDQGNPHKILKGLPSMLTSKCVAKPSYYAYYVLSRLQGDLICWGKNYSVCRLGDSVPVYVLLVYNFNDEIERLCERPATALETHDIIRDYNDEIDMNINLKIEEGEYAVMKYSLSKENSIFNYIAQLDFPSHLELPFDLSSVLYTSPWTDVYLDKSNGSICTNFSIKSVGLQLAFIQPKDSGKAYA